MVKKCSHCPEGATGGEATKSKVQQHLIHADNSTWKLLLIETNHH